MSVVLHHHHQQQQHRRRRRVRVISAPARKDDLLNEHCTCASAVDASRHVLQVLDAPADGNASSSSLSPPLVVEGRLSCGSAEQLPYNTVHTLQELQIVTLRQFAQSNGRLAFSLEAYSYKHNNFVDDSQWTWLKRPEGTVQKQHIGTRCSIVEGRSGYTSIGIGVAIQKCFGTPRTARLLPDMLVVAALPNGQGYHVLTDHQLVKVFAPVFQTSVAAASANDSEWLAQRIIQHFRSGSTLGYVSLFDDLVRFAHIPNPMAVDDNDEPHLVTLPVVPMRLYNLKVAQACVRYFERHWPDQAAELQAKQQAEAELLRVKRAKKREAAAALADASYQREQERRKAARHRVKIADVSSVFEPQQQPPPRSQDDDDDDDLITYDIAVPPPPAPYNTLNELAALCAARGYEKNVV